MTSSKINTKLIRHSVALIVLIALMVIIPIMNWPKSTEGRQLSQRSMAYQHVNVKLATMQAKLFMGTLIVQDNYPGQNTGLFEKWLALNESNMANKLVEPDNQIIVLGKFILARHFEKPQLAEHYLNKYMLLTDDEIEPYRSLKPIIDKLYFSTSIPQLEQNELDRLRKTLGWFGEVMSWEQLRHQMETDITQAAFYVQAKQSLAKASKVMVVVFAGLVISLVCFIGLIYWLVRRPSNQVAESDTLPSGLILETFVIYLSCGLLIAWVLKLINPKESLALSLESGLMINVLVKVLIISALGWPLLYKVFWQDWFKIVGVMRTAVSHWAKDVLFGVVAFFAFIPIGYGLLILTMLVANLIGLDPSQGTHPIIPMLQKINNHWQLALVFILAAVMAPIVEEIMFRGVLYSYLKKWMSFKIAIPVSGLLFAVLHPQGLIGIIPIMGIGCYLALIREWRQTLWSSMVVHAMINGSVLWLALTMFKM